jgi:hypothetical protein
MSDAIKVSGNEFNTLLGLDPTTHSRTNRQPDDTGFVSRYTPAETQAQLNRVYVRPPLEKGMDISPAGAITYFKPQLAKVGNNRLAAEKLRALAPEIDQSRTLVSSSIMSPNDLQDGRFMFKFDNIDALKSDPELLNKIAKLFDKHFNDTLELGIRSYDWISDAQYGSGSKCVLLLPNATHEEVRARSKASYGPIFDPKIAFESFDERVKSSDEFQYSNKKLTWKEYLNGVDSEKFVQETVPSMESFGVAVPDKYMSNAEKDKRNKKITFGSNYEASLEDMVVNLKTKMAEGDLIRITEDPDVIRFSSDKKDNDNRKFYNKLSDKYQLNKDPAYEEIVYLKSDPVGFEHHGHPTIIELPSESVIPIIIPGAPSQHLGYFVLLDSDGVPLTVEKAGLQDTSIECKSGSPNAAYEAMFGGNCCKSQYFSGANSIHNAGSMIFSHMLDGYIKARMHGIFGRENCELSKFNALSTVLFYRLLDFKQTTLLFVPSILLHYFAFDYDKNDGTGKSKTSEIQFLLSLRTTLMMANVVAAVNDAIEHKKVEFSVDDTNANIENIMELMANIFIDKNKLNGSVDPSEIMRDMYSNALTIVPKNIPGIGEMDVQVQQGGGQSARVDDSLFEKLSELLVSHLDVPAAALNQMSEPEFARSLVTYNLFFAKKIRRYQRIWCALMTRFIKAYISFDPIFCKALNKILTANVKKKRNDKLPNKVQELKALNPNKYAERNTLLQDIITQFTVELASPNIVVDKTQFEEINSFLTNLDAIADRFFNNELIPSSDEAAQEALPIVRAKWKMEQLMRFISEVGNFTMVDLPDMDELNPGELNDFIQVMRNAGMAIRKHREAIAPNDESPDSGFGSGGYGDSGDEGSGFEDEGGDDDFDMGEDEDMGGDESAMETSEETNQTTNTTSSESSENEESTGPSLSAQLYSKVRRAITKK